MNISALIHEILLHFSIDVLGVLLVLYIIPYFYGTKVDWSKFVSFDKYFFESIIGRYTITIVGLFLYFSFTKYL